MYRLVFFNAFPPPSVPHIAEKLSLAKKFLEFSEKFLEFRKKNLEFREKFLKVNRYFHRTSPT